MISRCSMIFISFAILAKIATLTDGSNSFNVPSVYPAVNNDPPVVSMDVFQVYTGPSNMKESKSIHAVVILSKDGKGGMDGVYGVLSFTQSNPNAPVKINGTINNLPPGKHGMHVHTFGDLRNGCTSCGVHFNPLMVKHGDIRDNIRHRHNGDLGNIDSNGNARVHIYDHILSLFGDNSILGRSMVVHEKMDDGGRGANEESTKTGNSGARVACGIIALSEF